MPDYSVLYMVSIKCLICIVNKFTYLGCANLAQSMRGVFRLI